jgi:hypothetical protein
MFRLIGFGVGLERKRQGSLIGDFCERRGRSYRKLITGIVPIQKHPILVCSCGGARLTNHFKRKALGREKAPSLQMQIWVSPKWQRLKCALLRAPCSGRYFLRTFVELFFY